MGLLKSLCHLNLLKNEPEDSEEDDVFGVEIGDVDPEVSKEDDSKAFYLDLSFRPDEASGGDGVIEPESKIKDVPEKKEVI